MNFTSATEHVPEAERNNRVIKERMRAAFHRLPFKTLPRIMIKILCMESAKKLNFFPPKGGVSSHYSPRMILHHETLDYQKHCAVPFGTYVQAHTEHPQHNSMEPRTIDGIYLRYVSDNTQGGHEILNLHTGRMIKRQHITHVPMTQSVIELVERMALQESMPTGLKITNKTGVILYDTAWSAGVDYQTQHEQDIQDYQDEDYEPRNEEEEDDDLDHEWERIDPNELADIVSEKTNHIPSDIDDEQEDDIPDLEQPVVRFNDEDDSDEEDDAEEEEQEHQDLPEQDTPPQVSQRGRTLKPNPKYNMMQFTHLHTQAPNEQVQYSMVTAQIIARVMNEIEHAANDKEHKHHAFVQTFSLMKGLKKFGAKGYEAAYGEMKQLHERTVFWPRHVKDLSQKERDRAMESLIFLVEKRDGRIKARTCANGSTQREYMNKEDATSPTVMTESILLTAAIEAKEGRDVMTVDIPNAFVQTDAGKDADGERNIMKIKGPLVDMLVELDPTRYKQFVTYESGKKVLYVEVLKAIYGMLQSALLFYNKLKKDLEGIGFKINPYDPCVANRTVDGNQHTVTWHVDDLKSSHVNSSVNDAFLKWLEDMYGDPKIGSVKAVRGKIHDYLAITLDYSTPGKVRIDMTDYVKSMIEEFPDELGTKQCKYPWDANLFKVEANGRQLPKEKAEIFHTFVAKGLFVTKRARPDIMPAIAFLSTRVKKPEHDDWFKLIKMMRFLKSTREDVLTLEIDKINMIKWHLDASFGVHDDMKSHTGSTMTLGKGAIQSISTKQKINTRSSTEAELVSFDDIISKVMWTKLFIEAQGYEIKENLVYRDNISSMKLEMNGKTSSGKRTRHFNIKYFFITDLIARNEVQTEFCPTGAMTADYMTKPLLGEKFVDFRKEVMNLN